MLVSITDLLVRASVLTETAPTPPDEELVSPGIIGFIATFFVALATVLLILDMVRRVRRVNYRDQVREKLLLEQAEAELAEKDAPAPDAAAPIADAAPE
ncbi:MAG: hypothetical protein ABWX82_08465, partial [Leifsonia sp.]